MVLALVMFGSYSSGSYMAAQKVIDEKQQKLETFAQENARVAAEFGMLKQDLMKLADGGNKGNKTADAAKDLAAQYSNADAAPVAGGTGNADIDSKYNVVFNRIQFLENKVRDLQSNHDAMMADIRATTGGKIKELERVIARTGVDSEPLQRAAEAKRLQEEQQREKYGRTVSGAAAAVAPAVSTGEGGPFIPASAAPVAPSTNPAAQPAAGPQGGPFIPLHSGSVLQQKDTELYFNLRKLVTLNDVVNAMPLDVPVAAGIDYHKTSGFGTRVDPFRGTLSFHAGVDLAAPTGTRVLATNDGRIEFAGWKTAYGNVVDVKHEYGFSTRYGHMSQILVRNGQLVKKGQVIGVEGSTGRSTGEHIHYEVRYNDEPINPANFLKVGEDVRALN